MWLDLIECPGVAFGLEGSFPFAVNFHQSVGSSIPNKNKKNQIKKQSHWGNLRGVPLLILLSSATSLQMRPKCLIG